MSTERIYELPLSYRWNCFGNESLCDLTEYVSYWNYGSKVEIKLSHRQCNCSKYYSRILFRKSIWFAYNAVDWNIQFFTGYSMIEVMPRILLVFEISEEIRRKVYRIKRQMESCQCSETYIMKGIRRNNLKNCIGVYHRHGKRYWQSENRKEFCFADSISYIWNAGFT